MMMKSLKISFLFLSVLLLICKVESSGFEKYAGEFLNPGVGGRALALGGAYVAVANDVTAGYWNPAGLIYSDGLQIQFMHEKRFISSIQFDYLGAANKFEDGSSIGISFIRLGIDDIKNTVNALAGQDVSEGFINSRITSFNTADHAFFLSYSRRYSENISYGANVKFIYRDYSSESALGIGFDVGLMMELQPNFKFGLILRDITTTMMAWSTSKKEFIKPSVRSGLSYIYQFEEIDLYVQPSFDAGIIFESRNQSSQINLGAISIDTFWGLEIGYSSVSFLRLGFDDIQRFCCGLGLSITKLAVDYSYTDYARELGNVHRISFHLKLDSI